METKIKELIEDAINPSLAQHEGGVEFHSLEKDGDSYLLTLDYTGSCVGCPSSSSGTLIMIQTFLQEELDEDIVVLKKE